jgi:hypothetical protein
VGELNRQLRRAPDSPGLWKICCPKRDSALISLGFWWSLLSDEYNRRLWQPCLQHAFDGPVRRARLHSELDEMRRLRNRIAHHEPIHRRDLAADHRRILDVAERISRRLSERIDLVSRVPEVLSKRPGR